MECLAGSSTGRQGRGGSGCRGLGLSQMQSIEGSTEGRAGRTAWQQQCEEQVVGHHQGVVSHLEQHGVMIGQGGSGLLAEGFSGSEQNSSTKGNGSSSSSHREGAWGGGVAEVCVQGSCVMAGYWNAPLETQQVR